MKMNKKIVLQLHLSLTLALVGA